MPILLWDASGLAKRYTVESGSDTANALFRMNPPLEMASTAWAYAETYSILLRRLNSGLLDGPTFRAAVSALQKEVVDDPDFGILTISDAAVFGCIGMMRKHNLNATDAAILTVFKAYSRSPSAPSCVLVASDKRLLRAAAGERFKTLDPETLAVSDIASFLASP